MDTIILFYKKRELKEAALAVAEMDGYRLVRVGIRGGEIDWFGRRMPVPICAGGPDAHVPVENITDGREDADTGAKENRKYSPFIWIREWRRKREEKREQELFRKAREETAHILEKEVRELAEHIYARTDALDDCACVYMDGVKPLLTGEGLLPEIWNRNWSMHEFADYTGYRWVRLLLPRAVYPHFVLLGKADCIPELLEDCARRMKSLRWILKEKDCDGEVLGVIEDFYEENGLAIIQQTVTGRNGFRTLCLEAAEPVCILDFTDEVKFFLGGLAEGSVWLDFASIEEKGRRMARLAPKISYVSLKELWRG